MGAETYVALFAAVVALGTGFAQWRASRRQHELQHEQNALVIQQQNAESEQQRVQRRLAEIEEHRFLFEEERRLSAQVVLTVNMAPAQRLTDVWVALDNIGAAPAQDVTLQVSVLKERIHGGRPVTIRSQDELPIVALGPGQSYPLLLAWNRPCVCVARISWTDPRGRHEVDYQVPAATKFTTPKESR